MIQKRLTLGIDLGGTKIESALVDEDGGILVSNRRATPASKDPDMVIANIVACAKECLDKARQSAVAAGIGAAGQISKDGVVRFSPNLEGWHDVPLRHRLESALGIPVVLTNDVRAAMWGEWRHGAGRGINDLVCIFVGTGIGGGIVTGGKALEGCGNTAGELGHTTIVAGGRQCHCPNQGCFEAYAGGWAIAERAREAVLADPIAGQVFMELAGNADNISAITLTQAYRKGDALARKLVAETAHYLAAGVVSVVNIFNPCLLIMGGGVIDGMPEYVSMLEPMVRAKALQATAEKLRIAISALGNKAGVIGAAALARDYISRKET